MGGRNDPGLKRRTTGKGGDDETERIAMKHASPAVRLISNEVAVGTAAGANREARCATNLFGESVRHLRQIVGLEAEVIGHGPRLTPSVAHILNVGSRT